MVKTAFIFSLVYRIFATSPRILLKNPENINMTKITNFLMIKKEDFSLFFEVKKKLQNSKGSLPS